jgi:uncharacterized protein (DUF1697 family)
MATYAAFLRAINVGGTGKLAMADLRALCIELGFSNVKTYIQSGNVVFESGAAMEKIKDQLTKALADHMGKPIDFYLRTASELEAVLRNNPFQAAKPERVIVLFLDLAAPPAALATIKAPANEEIVACGREVFVHFPDGQGKSKLRLPFADRATGRNLNTIRKVAQLTRLVGEA